MVEIIDNVKENTKDIKDKVVDNTKDVVDKTKDSVITPSSYSPPISYSYDPERKYDKSNPGIEIRKINNPITEYREEEQTIPVNIKEHESGAAINRNQVDTQYSYKENDAFFNPFMIGLKLWQNYSTMWMNFYNEVLNYTTKTNKDYGNKH